MTIEMAAEMLDIIERVSKYQHIMENELSQELASRIRRVLKEAHGV